MENTTIHQLPVSVQRRALMIVKSMLIARRNGYIQREQKCYDEFVALCRANNLDFAVSLEQATAKVRQSVGE